MKQGTWSRLDDQDASADRSPWCSPDVPLHPSSRKSAADISSSLWSLHAINQWCLELNNVFINRDYATKPGPSWATWAHRVAQVSISLAHSQTPTYAARPRGSRGVPVYSPTFTGTHCIYPQRDCQAELNCESGYTTGEAHSNMLALSQTADRSKNWQIV